MLFIILRLTSHISSRKFHREGRRAGRRAPAPTVSTGGRAHAVAPYNRLSNCVPEYSRGTTSRRRSVLLTRVYPRRAGGIGRPRYTAPTISVARALLPAASASRTDDSSRFSIIAGQIFDSSNFATRWHGGKMRERTRALPLPLTVWLREKTLVKKLNID